MDAFLVSAAVVTLAEIGDKTQLIALLLAAKFRQPVAVIAGMLVATLANHLVAGFTGAWVTQLLNPQLMRWLLGLGFLGTAAWTLIPDRADDAQVGRPGLGAFGATVVTFFLAEIGDKTQLATAMLAARYAPLAAVVAGTTCGMLIADIPAVLLGERLTRRIPATLMRTAAALLFSLLGVVTLLGAGRHFGF